MNLPNKKVIIFVCEFLRVLKTLSSFYMPENFKPQKSKTIK